MLHTQDCLICGSLLQYSETSEELQCTLCGALGTSTARCRRGHFVCDACHAARTLDYIEYVCTQSTSEDPIALASEIMMNASVNMHGPEHHFLVPAVLLAGYDNALKQPRKKSAHLAEARRRASRVPGGFCGTHGNCGAAVGTGIFWSIVSGATPLTQISWSESNLITAKSLLRVAEHGGPRCCKRNTWHSLLQAMQVVGEKHPETGWTADYPLPVCNHTHRNKQCLLKNCVFHPAAHKLRAKAASQSAC